MANLITPEQLALSGSEDGSQKALFCWAALSGIQELKWLFHIPNGGSRHIAEASKLKAMGVKSGVPDIFLPIKTQRWRVGANFNGLWIELKKPGRVGGVSDEQTDWMILLSSQQFQCKVCYGWEQARDAILWYLNNDAQVV